MCMMSPRERLSFTTITVSDLLNTCCSFVDYNTDDLCMKFLDDLLFVIRGIGNIDPDKLLLCQVICNEIFTLKSRHSSPNISLPSHIDIATQCNSNTSEKSENQAPRAIKKLEEIDNLIERLHCKKKQIYKYALEDTGSFTNFSDNQNLSVEPTCTFSPNVIAAAAKNHEKYIKIKKEVESEPPTSKFQFTMDHFQTFDTPFFLESSLKSGLINPEYCKEFTCSRFITSLKVTNTSILCGSVDGEVAVFSNDDFSLKLYKRIHVKSVTDFLKLKKNICLSSSFDTTISTFEEKDLVTKKYVSLKRPLQCMVELSDYIYIGSTDGFLYTLTLPTLQRSVRPVQVNKGFISMAVTKYLGCYVLAILSNDNKVTLRKCNSEFLLVLDIHSPVISMGVIVSDNNYFLLCQVVCQYSTADYYFCVHEDGYKLKYLQVSNDKFGAILCNNLSCIVSNLSKVCIGNKSGKVWSLLKLDLKCDLAVASTWGSIVAVVTVNNSLIVIKIPDNYISS